jgi:hypothetical protein
METVEEYTGVNVPKATAGTTVEVYRQAAIAAATALPLTLGAVGPLPTISQAQESVKRPEEHLPSQSQKANTIFEGGFLLSATSTSGNDFAVVKGGKKLYYTIDRKAPKKP